MKRVRECVHGAELGLQTLVWTKGAGFPLTRLESLLKCPRCGSRRVLLLFEPPSGARAEMGVGYRDENRSQRGGQNTILVRQSLGAIAHKPTERTEGRAKSTDTGQFSQERLFARSMA
jgi:hypothetical protein